MGRLSAPSRALQTALLAALALTALALGAFAAPAGASTNGGTPTPTATPPPQVGVWVVEGEAKAWLTAPSNVDAASLLAKARLPYPKGARLLVNGREWLGSSPIPCRAGEPCALHVIPPAYLALHSGDSTIHLTTTEPTVGAALGAIGLVVYAGDRLQPKPDFPLHGAMNAFLQGHKRVQVTVGGKAITLYTTAETVGAALAEANLAPQGIDETNPAPTAKLSEDSPISISRAREVVLLRQLPVAFGVKTKPLPDKPLDTTEILQKGQPGLQVQQIRIRYVDGKEILRRVEAKWITRPPKPRVVGYGTKIVLRTINTPEGPKQYWRAVRAYATSYSPCRLGVDYCSDITYSGMKLHKGIVAVKRSWYAYLAGTKVYVPGYGIGIIGDTGGGIPGRPWIDLGYSDNDYVSWHQWVTIYFLAPPPPKIPWILP